MRKQRVYIAGPISKLPYEVARVRFARAEEIIRAMGGEAVNPIKAEDTPNGLSYEAYMKRGLKELLDCDAICLLWEWRESRGALTEHSVAHAIGLRAYTMKPNKRVEVLFGKKRIEKFEEVAEESDDTTRRR